MEIIVYKPPTTIISSVVAECLYKKYTTIPPPSTPPNPVAAIASILEFIISSSLSEGCDCRKTKGMYINIRFLSKKYKFVAFNAIRRVQRDSYPFV
ncbi:MAG: hypothetical protein WC477_03215 [Patescibacteria group bacterium]